MTTEAFINPDYYEKLAEKDINMTLIEEGSPYYKVKIGSNTVLVFHDKEEKSFVALHDNGEVTQLVCMPSIEEKKLIYIAESGKRLFRKNGPVITCLEETGGNIYSFQYVGS